MINRLTLVGPTQIRNSDRRILYYYDCSCGGYALTSQKNVKNGNTKSCGCLKSESSANNVRKVQHLAAKAAKISNTKHGMRNTKFYRHWQGMHQRCKDKNDKNYGAKGIRVCARWNNFENFMKDMYDDYIIHSEIHGCDRKGTSLDRIDGNKSYSPNNCRWATAKTQRLNCSRIIKRNALGQII